MASVPPPNYFNNAEVAPEPLHLPQPQPPQPNLQPLEHLPPVPRWHLEPIQPQNPCELRDEQFQVIMASLAQEVAEHNSTRARLYRYVTGAMKHERDLNSERHSVRYLHAIIHDLRTQVQDEKMKRIAAEEEKQQLLLENEIECEMQCVSFLLCVLIKYSFRKQEYEPSAPPLNDDAQTLANLFDIEMPSSAPGDSGQASNQLPVHSNEVNYRHFNSPEVTTTRVKLCRQAKRSTG
ncbi:uncharacterized protein LY89DRAFT_153712 [Mollisia scopiformis]|uniref:Uncharacterized protein n=1 Tax=Mollisia scopiformis TaxID=149040 RepID=A0A194WZY1_MOLSC|nr:uncharacterized protein LY89DRAFT_153712 [Mollisia scopiformis]KUJ13172.1 hypothetical protein LY89DRAFT_153712 [Mollisia scopiformis]